MASKKYREEQRRLGALLQRLEEWERYSDDDFSGFDRLCREPKDKKERQWQKRQKKRKLERAENDIAALEQKLNLRPGYVVVAKPTSSHGTNVGPKYYYEVQYPNERAS